MDSKNKKSLEGMLVCEMKLLFVRPNTTQTILQTGETNTNFDLNLKGGKRDIINSRHLI